MNAERCLLAGEALEFGHAALERASKDARERVVLSALVAEVTKKRFVSFYQQLMIPAIRSEEEPWPNNHGRLTVMFGSRL